MVAGRGWDQTIDPGKTGRTRKERHARRGCAGGIHRSRPGNEEIAVTSNIPGCDIKAHLTGDIAAV